MNIHTVGNFCEAGLWFAVAAALAFKAFRGPAAQRRVLSFLSAAFAAFGVSDLIEANTGAWWRPWWLLALKGLCLIAIAAGFRKYFQLTKERPAADDSGSSARE